MESNSKVYWSIIAGIAACLILYIIEIVHIQNIFSQVKDLESSVVRAMIDPIAQKYQWARIVLFFLAIVCAVIQYYKAKKELHL